MSGEQQAAPEGAGTGARQVDLWSLSLEQLHQVRQQHEEELGVLRQQLSALSDAAARFQRSRAAVDGLGAARSGQTVLVPLSESLYVTGTVEDPQHVLVELGTGYFAEKNLHGAREFMERKTQFISQNADEVQKAITHKTRNMEVIGMVLQQKVQMTEQAMAEAHAPGGAVEQAASS